MLQTRNKNELINIFSGISGKVYDVGGNTVKGFVDILSYISDDLIKFFSFKNYLIHNTVKNGIFDFIKGLSKLEKIEMDDLLRLVNDALKNGINGQVKKYLTGQIDKLISASRYPYVIKNIGKELFGSAKFKNEVLLHENEYYTLTYIPENKGNRKASLFHVGGMLPYSDKIFRLLPETNFFNPFINQGISVYAMEIKGDINTNPELKNLTIEKMIESIHEFSSIAFEHNSREKMILEGYCGLAMPTVASFLADLESMDKKFGVISLFVAPVDGRKCTKLNALISALPESLAYLFFLVNSLSGKVISGANIGKSIDMVTRSLFSKSIPGRFITGWMSGKYHGIEQAQELDHKTRLELAGAYWISPESAKRFPVPVEITRFSSSLFKKGIDENGIIPYKVNSAELNIHDLNKSSVEVVGFYGKDDPMINHESGFVLKHILNDKYTHVVHEKTGHISYVFSNSRWYEENGKSFKPGIIPVLLEKINK